jgi:hypothetical protein
MNVSSLIDAVVRQTTVLIAQLATSAGIRAPLAHVADQVFLDLVRALRGQGVGGKVIADMFGMALRTYHGRVQRLSESATDRGRTLWEAVLGFVQERGLVPRGDVMQRFRYDDEATVRGVLNDLVESGLVFKSGRGDRTVYRAASPEELGTGDRAEGDAALVWVAVNRYQPATREQIAAALVMDEAALDAALARLVADGRVVEADGGYRCDACFVPYGTPAGWEAALFDHYQAMVTAICTKLRRGANQARPDDRIGGSTYGFDVWPGHPFEDEVYGLLRETRAKASDLRARVDGHNAGAGAPPDETRRVIFYVGQTLREENET